MSKPIAMSVLKQIIRQWRCNTPIKTISRHSGVARNTVKTYVKLIRSGGLCCKQLLGMEDHELEAVFFQSPETGRRYSALLKQIPYFVKELNRTGVNRHVLWEEYLQGHPDGYQYSQFCYHLQQYLQSEHATLHIEQKPGDKLYVDFTGKKLKWVDPGTGEVHDAEVFVAVLGHSHLTYVEAVVSQKQACFLSAVSNALHFFGGVPRAIVPDNLKAAVIKADRYEPTVNEALSDLANHYQTTIYPTRSRKPRDKSWVENMVRTVYSRVFAPLRNETFGSLEELNRAVWQQLEKHNNKPFQGEDFSRRQRFEEHEKEHLASLPAERYQRKQYRDQKVRKNCHIYLNEDKHYYSVPYRYIGKTVRVITTHGQVSVLHDRQRIAFHKRNFKTYGYTTLKDHLPSHHRFVAQWNPEKFLNWAAGIHPDVRRFIGAVLDSKPYPELAYQSCVGILSMDKKRGRQRLIAACRRAAHFQSYNYSTIKRILDKGLDKDPLPDDKQMQINLPDHDNIRGSEAFQ